MKAYIIIDHSNLEIYNETFSVNSNIPIQNYKIYHLLDLYDDFRTYIVHPLLILSTCSMKFF